MKWRDARSELARFRHKYKYLYLRENHIKNQKIWRCAVFALHLLHFATSSCCWPGARKALPPARVLTGADRACYTLWAC